jgi:NADH dehydrogenase
VIGSGFGGLFGTKALRRADVDVTVIAKTTHHLFQPLLYQVATGILSEGEIAPPTREVLSSQDNASVILGEVTDIDLTAKTVTSQVLGRDTVTSYDSLLVAAGAGQSYFGNDHFAEFAPGMKSIDDALELRGRIFGAFEMAELGATRGDDVDHLLTFVVVGAGPTGVEMAGQIAELAHRTLRKDFRAINTRTARVVLVDAAPQVLPPFGAKLGAKAQRELEKLGVEVMLGGMVTEVDERGLEVKFKDGRTERIDSVAKIWAAGVQASPLARTLAEQSGAPLDRAGRIGVNPDLTLPGHPEVFVVGDMIALDNLPGVAQVAIQGAKYAAKEIRNRLEDKAPQPPFKYFDKGSMAIISRFRAVAMVGKLRLTGIVAWLMWLGVHLVYLTGFKNQVSALMRWAITFISNNRSERPRPRNETAQCRTAVIRFLKPVT